MENNDIKHKVTIVVDSYLKNYKTEATQFAKEIKLYREGLNNKWAELKKGSDIVVRELNRYPETLDALIKIGLDDAEYIEFRSQKMQFWFGNQFPIFKVTEGKL